MVDPGKAIIAVIFLLIAIQAITTVLPDIVVATGSAAFNATGNDEAAGNFENASSLGKTVASFITIFVVIAALLLAVNFGKQQLGK